MSDKLAFEPHKVNKIRALNDDVIVTDMKFEERLSSGGIVLLNDDANSTGIRPRWAKVYAIGPEQREIEPGQWVYIEHGRWSRGIEVEIDDEQFTLRRIDPKCIIFVSDEEPPSDDTFSDKVQAESKTR